MSEENLPYKLPDMSATEIAVVEEKRRQAYQLCKDCHFDEAALLVVSLPEEVAIFTPCEHIADHIRQSDPELASKLYELAVQYHLWQGTEATGSGEGIVAMDAARRVKNKIKALTDK